MPQAEVIRVCMKCGAKHEYRGERDVRLRELDEFECSDCLLKFIRSQKEEA